MTDTDGAAESLLATRIGLDPRTVGPGTIARALHARMSALGLADRAAYLRRLADSEEEQQELVEEVVIPESWFFRDDRPFAALRSYAEAHLRGDAGGGGPPLRVLSIPCACGEEPYSITITLLDLGLAAGRFQIDAVDVSARHLASAARGVFRAQAFRGADLSFRDRHFRPDPHGQGFTLDPSVRRTVRFVRGNLLDPRLLEGQSPYDIIFCRNVLIYLDAASRRRVLATLDRLLARDGRLFVGHADRLTMDRYPFEPWGENASFALRRAQPPRGEKPAPEPPAGTPPRPIPARVVPAAEAPPRPPLPPPPRTPLPLPETTATLLDEAAALADRGRLDEAAARCEAALGRFGPSARAYFLLGIVRQAGGRQAEAESLFRKTIYLEPAHDEALLALDLIAQRRGDHGAALGYRRRAERARSRKPPP
jgi:chemotaxis protein methyltransferase WspC